MNALFNLEEDKNEQTNLYNLSEDRDFLSFTLRHAGLAVARTASAEHVRSALLDNPVDLILLVRDLAMARRMAEMEWLSQTLQACFRHAAMHDLS